MLTIALQLQEGWSLGCLATVFPPLEKSQVITNQGSGNEFLGPKGGVLLTLAR